MIRRIALSFATVLAGALLIGGTATATPLVDRLLATAVHAEVTTRFANGRTRTVAVDKGRVTSRTATELVIRRADGKTVTFTLAANVRATYGWRGARTIGRLRTNAWVKVVSENGKALSISTTASAFARS